ncbi:MAG: thioredoxin-disulfide reductase [Lachnospiraceae bacterium]|nr:thioredoxin-disulfide reductase [Lachnospiraceae bacterium]
MDKIYDLIIIGGGPAGLSAAVYAERAKLDMILLEKAPVSGGQVLNTYEVDNYLGLPGINGFDLGMKFKEHAEKLGVTFKDGDVVSIDVKGDVKSIVTDKETYKAKSVIIATGAAHRKLGVPGEEELSGMGVSYCATCDGAFFKGREVAVVGGGDVAVEDAIFLARLCEKVYVIHRRDEFRAAKTLVESLKQCPNVEIIWDSVVEEIKGEDEVQAVSLKNVKTGENSEVELQGVFVAVGMLPNTSAFAGGPIDLDATGYIKAGEDCATNVAGVFAAGDVRTKSLRQIVTAVADGANAVTSVEKYLM